MKIDAFSLSVQGHELVKDCTLELTQGRRYGLIGANGCGKTSLLDCLARREVPIPEHVDIYHLREEAPPTDMLPVEMVVDSVQQEIARLRKEEEAILETTGAEDPRLAYVYEKLESLDPASFESDATKLLVGLGFTQQMLAKPTKDMSGGWRMRVALARALFVAPSLLLLDGTIPTRNLKS